MFLSKTEVRPPVLNVPGPVLRASVGNSITYIGWAEDVSWAKLVLGTFTSTGTVLAKVRCRRMKPPRRILNQPVVLLVEDEFLVRQTLVDILREAEFWVVEAQDADEAFELLRSRADVAAVLTDVSMPGSMDGFEFARLVRQGWPVVGVIVISGQADPGPGDLPSHATFLRKPFRPATLIKTLRDVMVTG